jgi:hypothetical protein
MKPTNRKRSARLVIVGLVAALALAYSGVTFAASSAPTSINTCTKVNKHGVYGKTKVTAASSCPAHQAFQTWNQSQFDSDPIVAGHADGYIGILSNTTIATLTIPTSGTYAVSAKVTLFNGYAGTQPDYCGLTGPTVANADHSRVDLPPGTVSTPTAAGVSLQIVDTFSAGDSVALTCNAGSFPNQHTEFARITATAGTGLTNTAL